jgi:hypothetical protein
MLAGLITERREQGNSGVFELTRLPFVDGLFGKIVNVFERTEPVVLLSHDNARLVTQGFKVKKGIYEQLECTEVKKKSDFDQLFA